MISAFIFSAHLLFALIIFTRKWQFESASAAWINIVLIGILFSVGWTITGSVLPLLMDSKGFGLYFDRDTASLTLLTLGEIFFYNIYYKDVFSEEKRALIEAGKEKQ